MNKKSKSAIKPPHPFGIGNNYLGGEPLGCMPILILFVLLGLGLLTVVGCRESHRSMNNRFSDSVIKYWSLEKCSWECNKKDSMDYYSKRGNLYNDSLKYLWHVDFPNEKQKSRNIPQTKCPCNEDWSKWSNVSGILPIVKDTEGLTSSTSNDSLVYQFGDTSEPGKAIIGSGLTYKYTPQDSDIYKAYYDDNGLIYVTDSRGQHVGMFFSREDLENDTLVMKHRRDEYRGHPEGWNVGAIDAVMQDYRKYGLPKHKSIIIPCCDLETPSKPVSKRMWATPKDCIRVGNLPDTVKPKMGIRGKSKSYYLPRSTMAERLWNKSAQVKNDTLIREGDNGMEYYDGKEWKTIHYDSIQMSTSEYNKFLERWWKQSKTKLVWQVGDSGVKLPKGTSPEKYNSKNDTGYDWKFSDTASGIEYLQEGKWKFVRYKAFEYHDDPSIIGGSSTHGTKKDFDSLDYYMKQYIKKDTTKKHQP